MVAMDLTRFAAVIKRPRRVFALVAAQLRPTRVVSVVVPRRHHLQRRPGRVPEGARDDRRTCSPRRALRVHDLGPPPCSDRRWRGPIALFGPVTTVVADAVSYLLSAAGIRAIGGRKPRPGAHRGAAAARRDLLEGWRYILTHSACARCSSTPSWSTA